jgi:hypothetical protein
MLTHGGSVSTRNSDRQEADTEFLEVLHSIVAFFATLRLSVKYS